MVIRASSSRQVDALIADLASASGVARDSAVARLIVIGPRAVDRLIAVAASPATAPGARVAALHALEGTGDLRAAAPAIALLDDPDEQVAVAAVGVLQGVMASARGLDVLDRMTGMALDGTRPRSVRLAVIRAIRGLSASTVGPLLQALGSDPDPAVASAAGLGPAVSTDPVYQLQEAVAGSLPESPAALRVALAEGGDHLPVTVLHQLIERIRFREGALTGQSRAEWTALRAAAHAALAHRGSRLALYDLRETLESAREPLPVEFLGAAAAIGDVACLEAIATAVARTMTHAVPEDAWWRQRLADVFRIIAAREGITRRHAAGKRLTAKWKQAAAILWEPT